MIRLMWGLLLSLLAWGSVMASTATTTASSGCVVLVHGLAGQGWNWWRLVPLLQRYDYVVVRAHYASRQLTLAQTTPLLAQAVQQCPAGLPVSLVGHSLGGVVIRQYLSSPNRPAVARVVLLGTPNRGSHLADPAPRPAWYNQLTAWALGPVLPQLSTAADSAVNQLPAIDVPTGVLAGNVHFRPWVSSRFQGHAHDGLVAVDYTKVAGMQDFAVLPTTHVGLLVDIDALRQVLWFLNTGRFFHPNSPDPK